MSPDRATPDPTLLPSRAMRLAALGALVQKPRAYASLAQEIRDLAVAVVGPSPDAFASSLELLRYDGLITGGEEGEGNVSITPAGRDEFAQLMVTRLRKPTGEFNRLWLALKLRFLPLLAPPNQAEEIGRMLALFEGEIDRLGVLRHNQLTTEGHIGAWIDLEIAENGARLAWCRSLGMRLDHAAVDPTA